eukprot:GCRY01000433.1.p1 GENE.GCRY01000433.1~~GCRY01000433.1.p1  ORF type:complete len:939 (+),score=245.39 GCRY01000433.1:181-2997(+)
MTVDNIEVLFRIQYTIHNKDQGIVVCGNHPLLGDWNPYNTLPLHRAFGNELWEASITIPRSTIPKEGLQYKYVTMTNGHEERWERDANHSISEAILSAHSRIELNDSWNPNRPVEERVQLTKAFYGAVHSRPISTPKPVETKPDSFLAHFQVSAPWVPSSYKMFLTGDIDELGHWKIEHSPQMNDQDFPSWNLDIALRQNVTSFQYKYVIMRKDESLIWETTPRWFTAPSLSSKDLSKLFVNKNDGRFCIPPHSEKIAFKGAGVIVPVFSLRSEKNCGVGEFLDLIPFVDWANIAGMKLIQTLPVTDSTIRGDWIDSYPYSPASVFALHPLYMNLPAISKKLPQALLEDIKNVSTRLSAEPLVDYEAVMQAKMKFLQEIYDIVGNTTLNLDDFKEWKAQNAKWLIPYGVFCALRNKHKTWKIKQWPADDSNLPREKIESLASSLNDEKGRLAVNFVYFIQYHLHLQLKQASDYAASHGVVLKGDIPIGVDPNGCDAWSFPNLFRPNTQTGAPPDDFSANGQNWGFPTYNWAEMAKDGFGWWRERLSHMSQYFHAFRVDHVLGFFRIWELPAHTVGGMLGHFHPSIPVTRDWLNSVSPAMWDIERLTKPYIREHVLQELLGHNPELLSQLKGIFLDSFYPGCYDFKPEFTTEMAVQEYLDEGHFPDWANLILSEKVTVLSVCFELLRNVVLIVDPNNSEHFYPRFGMAKTSSFRELPPEHRHEAYRMHQWYFYGEQQDNMWRENARAKLDLLVEATDMLCCAEDLGMIPASVAQSLIDHDILGLRVQRMPKDPHLEFDLPHHYPYLSIATPSTHDSSSIRGWWEEDAAVTQRYYNQVLHWGGVAPSYATPEVCEAVIQQHLHSPAMWTVLLIQDYFSLENALRSEFPDSEQINVPAIKYHYWRYKMTTTVENLLDMHVGVAHRLHRLIKDSGRLGAYAF